ncbi:MAG: hypothetical protein IJX90_11495 [Blautia sp.]|nr:hypothetical protein [Blautia sp.]
MRIDKGYWGNWITEGWPMEEVKVSDKDRQILRDLAMKFREYCERPEEKIKIRLWKDHNDLKTTRPLILVDMENGWNEAIRFDRDIICEGTMAQDWEMWLRKEIFYAEKMRDDKPLTPVFYLPHRAINTEWGIGENKVEIDTGDDNAKNAAYAWVPTMKDMDDDEFDELDVEKEIQDPVVIVDEKTTNAYFELAKEVFDGILEVRMRTWWFWSPHMTLAYSNFRGMDTMMTDFYDFPDTVHNIFQKLTDGYIKKLKFLEANNLLYNNTDNTFVGSGGLGWTDTLGTDPDHVTLKTMWGLTEAQELGQVSVSLYKEFIFPYFKQVAELFGLTCYACCEGINAMWDDVKQIPNLRRVSVSQWSNMALMSDYLGGDYVYSYKANSAHVSVPNMDEDVIRQELRAMYEKTVNNHVEVVLKDLHTISNKPEQVIRWVEIAREELNRVYG